MFISRFAWALALLLGLGLVPTVSVAEPAQAHTAIKNGHIKRHSAHTCTYNEMPQQCQTVSAQRREKQCHETVPLALLCSSSILRILLFHVADDRLPTVIHMDMFDADKCPGNTA